MQNYCWIFETYAQVYFVVTTINMPVTFSIPAGLGNLHTAEPASLQVKRRKWWWCCRRQACTTKAWQTLMETIVSEEEARKGAPLQVFPPEWWKSCWKWNKFQNIPWHIHCGSKQRKLFGCQNEYIFIFFFKNYEAKNSSSTRLREKQVEEKEYAICQLEMRNSWAERLNLKKIQILQYQWKRAKNLDSVIVLEKTEVVFN